MENEKDSPCVLSKFNVVRDFGFKSSGKALHSIVILGRLIALSHKIIYLRLMA